MPATTTEDHAGEDFREPAPETGHNQAAVDPLHPRGHLGQGIYALVGEVGGEVGGAIWTSFLVAIVIALLTAFAYAELITRYPYAAGVARYVHTAFRQSFFTFMIAFAVMASGITSASAATRVFGGAS